MKFLLSAILFFISTNLYTQNINLEWTKSIGGLGNSGAIDASGNVYTTGSFAGTVDFDPGSGVSNLTSSGGNDIFIQKLDANGNFIWVKQLGGISNDAGYSITTDASGNVYITGYFSLNLGGGISSNGGYDIFIAKLDSNGNIVWIKSMGGTSSDYGESITTDASGNVYTTGFFYNTVDFNPGSGVSNLVSNGGYDIFIQKLDANGNFLWLNLWEAQVLILDVP